VGRDTSVSLDPAFSMAIPGVVAEVEASTRAELVVVVYRTPNGPGALALSGGLLGGLLSLATCLWAPILIPEAGVMFAVTVAAVVGGGLGWLLRLRTEPEQAGRARALRRAQAAFVRYGVHRTRERTGMVILLDETEGCVSLVVDTAVEGAVPAGRLDGVRFGRGPDGRQLDGLQPVLDGLRQLGALLSQALPADREDNPEELDNAPRVMP